MRLRAGRLTPRLVAMAAVLPLALPAPSAGAGQPDARTAETEAFVKLADELIRGNDYDIKSTAHYKVKTDDPRFNVAAAAGLLESFRGFFDDFWKGRAELLPYDEPARIYLFYSRAKFRRLGVNEERPDDLALIGQYQDVVDVVVLHTDSVRLEEFPDALLHEAAHQLVQRRLYGESGTPRLWVAEGLANYFGNTLRDESGKFHAGEIGGKEITFFKGVSRAGGRLGWTQAKAYRRLVADGEALMLDTVIRTDNPAIFYDSRALERYTASWMLIHYLLHADAGAHVAGFVAYLKHDAAGDGSADTFYRDIGMPADKLGAAFRSYVMELKAR